MTVLAFIIGIVLMVVGLAVSIALHELGHLAPAKAFGVRVGQYMIGFGPTLWSRRVGETQYGFKVIPLGGYISMAGMYPPSAAERDAAEKEAADKDGAAAQHPARGRFFRTMIQDARSANDETLIAGADTHVFYKLPVYKRVIIMLGGPIMNLALAIVLFAILFSGIGVQTATTTVASVSQCVVSPTENRTDCTSSDPVAPAAAAGLQPDDTIISIDGTAVSTFAETSDIIRDSPNVPLDVVIERAGARQTLTITPLLTPRAVTDAAGNAVTNADGSVQTVDVGFVGIAPAWALVRQPLWAGPEAAFANVGAVAGVMVQLPAKVWDTAVTLVTGGQRDPNGPLSVVGAGILSGEVASADVPILNRIGGFLSLLASLNIALFVFNLVPLLPLDGGHVVVALWDGLKRAWAKLFRRGSPTPVDATRLVPVTFVVVVLLIAMSGVLIVADLVNPVSIVN